MTSARPLGSHPLRLGVGELLLGPPGPPGDRTARSTLTAPPTDSHRWPPQVQRRPRGRCQIRGRTGRRPCSFRGTGTARETTRGCRPARAARGPAADTARPARRGSPRHLAVPEAEVPRTQTVLVPARAAWSSTAKPKPALPCQSPASSRAPGSASGSGPSAATASTSQQSASSGAGGAASRPATCKIDQRWPLSAGSPAAERSQAPGRSHRVSRHSTLRGFLHGEWSAPIRHPDRSDDSALTHRVSSS